MTDQTMPDIINVWGNGKMPQQSGFWNTDPDPANGYKYHSNQAHKEALRKQREACAKKAIKNIHQWCLEKDTHLGVSESLLAEIIENAGVDDD